MFAESEKYSIFHYSLTTCNTEYKHNIKQTIYKYKRGTKDTRGTVKLINRK